MEPEVAQALQKDYIIDITTTGRRSGQPRRIEIAYHRVDGRFYISGLPGRRGWYANLLANPDFTFHLKKSIQKDLPATAFPVEEEAKRRTILGPITKKWGRENALEAFVADSPLVEVKFQDTG